jgi:hypothetical protein
MKVLLYFAIRPVVLAICILIDEPNYYYNYGSSLAVEQQKFGGQNLMIMVAENDKYLEALPISLVI